MKVFISKAISIQDDNHEDNNEFDDLDYNHATAMDS